MKVRKALVDLRNDSEWLLLQWGRTREGAEGDRGIDLTHQKTSFSGAAPVKVRKATMA